MHALARLIREYQERTGESYGDIAKRGGLPKANVGAWAAKPVHAMPRPENLVKLAKGLQTGIETVTRAAQEAAGYHVGEAETPDGTRILISHYTQLTPEGQDKVAALVERLLREHRGGAQ
jgi:hypothetical protein